MAKVKDQDRDELELKYRPENFEEYFGGDILKKSVLAELKTKRMYLFHGPRGCGKTTLARLMARELNIDDKDVREIDAADKTGVDDARHIKEMSAYLPLNGKNKMYIIDECHRMSAQAMDSLLKTFEAPPAHCYFVLCTTELAKVPATVQSRASRYEVVPLSEGLAKELLEWICQNENWNVDPNIIRTIIEQCDKIPREMIIALSRVKNMTSVDEAIELIQPIKMGKTVVDLCRAFLKNEPWSVISSILRDTGDEPESVRYGVLGYMNSVLLGKDTRSHAKAAVIIVRFENSFMYSKKAGLTLACYDIVTGGN